MSSVLPVIEMPKKEPEPEPMPSQSPENKLRTATDSVALAEQAGNMELIDQLMEEKEVDLTEDDIINIEESETPEEDDVFSDPLPSADPPRVAPVLEEDEQPNEFTPIGEKKKGKRKYTRTKPMSDKQKTHLAKIRQIAIEKRKAEKERKLKEKEEAVIAKAEKKILDKRKKEEQAQAEQQKPKLRSEKPQAVIQQNGFTKDDLDNAVLSAISQYDTLRKQRKKEKVENESKQREEDKMRATLARAIQPQKTAAPDPWRSLFG